MQFRKAKPEDIRDISRIHALSWKTAYKGMVPQQFLDDLKEDHWIEPFTNAFHENRLSAQLVCDNEIPVGCISYGKSRDSGLSDWGEIVSFYLLPCYWGKGYAAPLLELAMADLGRSYRSIFLWVLKDNLRARKFYENNNFYWNNDEFNFEIMGQQLIHVRYVFSFENNPVRDRKL